MAAILDAPARAPQTHLPSAAWARLPRRAAARYSRAVSELEPPISLEQLAGISAALEEQIPLAEVLEQEQVDEAAFRAGERAWRARIAESLPTQLEYTEKYRVAQDCLARKLAPVEDDPAAWVGLLGALATSLDSSELLTQLGITINDVGRLGRQWKRRAQKDPAVGAQLAELAKDAKAPEKITAGPLALKPFPWTPKVKRPAVEPPAPEVLLAAELDQVAAAAPVQRALASFQVVEHAPAPLAAARPSEPAPPEPAPLEPSPPEPSFESWSLEHYARLAWELRKSPSELDAVMRRFGLTTVESRRAIHQHFRRRFDSEPGLRARFDAWLSAAEGAARPAGPGRTDEIDHRALLRAATPFPASRPVEQNAGARRPSSRPRTGERNAKGNADVADVLARMQAAFPRPAGESGSTGPAGGRLAATAEMEDTPGSGGPALPFDAGPATPPAASLGGKRQSGRTVALPTPLGWSLEQYAALCADLTSGELPEAHVLRAAGLTAEAREVLDAYWVPRLQAESDTRSEWQYYLGRRAAERQRR